MRRTHPPGPAPTDAGHSHKPDTTLLIDEITATTQGMSRYLLQAAAFERDDRLWPAHYLVFATNPLSVAYGACGPALFLRVADAGPLPAEIVAWLRRRPVSVEDYPPGLMVGLAGIAATFLDIDLCDDAEAVMRTAYRSALLYEEADVALGTAGWGAVSLDLFGRTGRQLYLDSAVQAGENLLRTALHADGTCHWRRRQDDRVHYGFGYGASGIALFLLRLAMATGRDDFRACAIRALEFDLAHKVENALGWQWRRFESDAALYPYFMHGSAGIGSVLVRFHRLLGDARYGDIARRLGDDVFVKYALTPGLFEGLAGIGEFMLDLHISTGDELYRYRAFDIAETILWFRLDRPQGITFPGRWLGRVCADYATGAAGIGLFFTRLLTAHRRHFLDPAAAPH